MARRQYFESGNLPADDPGADGVASRDATYLHRLAALNAAEAELRRPGLSQEARDEAAIIAAHWQRSLDRRLEALANGAKPSDRVIADTVADPAIGLAVARAARGVIDRRRPMAFEDSYCL